MLIGFRHGGRNDARRPHLPLAVSWNDSDDKRGMTGRQVNKNPSDEGFLAEKPEKL
jgi:hypothetical protein